MIVKVQLPVATSRTLPPSEALVYAEGRKNLAVQKIPLWVVSIIRDTLKGFFEAELVDGRWQIIKHVADQSW